MNQYASQPELFASESLRIEAVTTCIGFDDVLDETLGHNHPNLDTMIVVTSHEDKKTQEVGAMFAGTVKVTLVKNSEANDDFPTFETTGVKYASAS